MEIPPSTERVISSRWRDGRLPDAHQPIIISRCDALSIRGPGDRHHPIEVTMVRQHRVCRGNIPYPPDLHRLIITGRSEMATIRGPGEGSNCVSMTTKGPEASACSSIPDLHGLVKTGGSNVLP